MFPDNLQPPLQTLLQQELKPHERILWRGQPSPRRMASKCVIQCFVGLVFASFGGFAIVTGIINREINEFSLGLLLALVFVSAFIGIGGALMLMPLLAWRKAHKTIYAITSKRALVIHATKGVDVFTYFPSEDVKEVFRKECADGSGDLLFAFDYSYDSITHVGFIGIPDVRAVEQILCKMRDENLAALKR